MDRFIMFTQNLWVFLPGNVASDLLQKGLNDPLPPKKAKPTTSNHKDLVS